MAEENNEKPILTFADSALHALYLEWTELSDNEGIGGNGVPHIKMADIKTHLESRGFVFPLPHATRDQQETESAVDTCVHSLIDKRGGFPELAGTEAYIAFVNAWSQCQAEIDKHVGLWPNNEGAKVKEK